MASISLADVLELPLDERLKLAEAIWDSIAEVPESIPITEAERMELDRRLDAYYADPGGGTPWPEVRERLLSRR